MKRIDQIEQLGVMSEEFIAAFRERSSIQQSLLRLTRHLGAKITRENLLTMLVNMTEREEQEYLAWLRQKHDKPTFGFRLTAVASTRKVSDIIILDPIIDVDNLANAIEALVVSKKSPIPDAHGDVPPETTRSKKRKRIMGMGKIMKRRRTMQMIDLPSRPKSDH